jgi:hypothetical protein
MPRLLLQASVLALAFAAPLFAAEAVTKAQVLEAIRTFDANAGGNAAPGMPVQDVNDVVARASNTILRFSLESDDVVVDLGVDSVPWCDVKKGISTLSNSGERGLLLAAYLSGSVKSQLQSGLKDPNPYRGWVTMLHIYRTLRIQEGVKIPEIDVLLARQADGTLEAFAAQAVQKSAANLRKTYGAAGGTPKQIVTASAQP